MSLIFSPLAKSHNKKSFTCGQDALDRYLQKQARQDAERGFATVIVAAQEDVPETIIGYYTLSAASVSLNRLPDTTRRVLPHVQQFYKKCMFTSFFDNQMYLWMHRAQAKALITA